MENPIKMDDLGVPLFLETPKYGTENPKKTDPTVERMTLEFGSSVPRFGFPPRWLSESTGRQKTGQKSRFVGGWSSHLLIEILIIGI